MSKKEVHNLKKREFIKKDILAINIYGELDILKKLILLKFKYSFYQYNSISLDSKNDI